MTEYIVVFIVGIVCIALGISNMRGNLSSLHSYHRNKISEEDRIPFGKKVGLGTILCGCALILYGIFSVVGYYSTNTAFATVATVLLIAGLAVGLGLSLYAILKYNKRIF